MVKLHLQLLSQLYYLKKVWLKLQLTTKSMALQKNANAESLSQLLTLSTKLKHVTMLTLTAQDTRTTLKT